jgi:hypothetical protein
VYTVVQGSPSTCSSVLYPNEDVEEELHKLTVYSSL